MTPDAPLVPAENSACAKFQIMMINAFPGMHSATSAEGTADRKVPINNTDLMQETKRKP